MITTKNLLGALAALTISTVAFAQTEPASPAAGSRSLLGQRYLDAGIAFVDLNHSSIDAYATGVTVNLPATANIDVAFNWTHEWLEAHSDVDAHTLSVDGIYYIDSGALKPFGGLSLGYVWADWEDDSIWGAFGGVEYQVASNVVLTARVGYDADFDDADEGSFDLSVSGRYFLTDTLAVSAGVSFIEGGDVGYVAGVTLKF